MKPAVAVTRSPDETRRLGSRLGRLLRPFDVVALSGPLGAGKTVLVSGLASGLGFKGRTASPSFTLAREYAGPKFRLCHLDLFRLGPGELGNVGLEEYLSDGGAACAIEWPEAASGLLPDDRLDVRIEVLPRGRRLEARAGGPRSKRLLAAFGAPRPEPKAQRGRGRGPRFRGPRLVT